MGYAPLFFMQPMLMLYYDCLTLLLFIQNISIMKLANFLEVLEED